VEKRDTHSKTTGAVRCSAGSVGASLAFRCFGALFAAAVVITLIGVLTPGFGRAFNALAAGLVEDPTLLAAFTT
jgi:hypothetical protein